MPYHSQVLFVFTVKLMFAAIFTSVTLNGTLSSLRKCYKRTCLYDYRLLNAVRLESGIFIYIYFAVGISRTYKPKLSRIMLNSNREGAKHKQVLPHQNGNGELKKNAKRKATSSSPSPNTSISATDNSQAKKLKLKRELHKVASVDEINQLQASEKLYHSNFFHLQMEELLKATKLSEKRRAFIDTWLELLTTFLTSLDSDEKKQAVSDLKWLRKKNICWPISDAIPFDTSLKYFFQFLTPISVFPIGALRTATVIDATDLVLDVCLEIPHEFFHKTNHLNGIYHRKRALYLSYVALQLLRWDQIAECKFTLVQNDPLQPAISMRPIGKYGKHLTINLHAVCGEESFKIERFAPEKSNVKQLIGPDGGELQKNNEHTATPHYNSCILGDLNRKFNEEYLANTIAENANVRDALVLLEIWLRQRDLDRGYGGMTKFILAMFVAYLIQCKRISLSMNSYQIIRQVWIHFGSTAWNEMGKSISMYESKFRTSQPPPEEFHKYFDVVFIDPTGYYNICAKLSLDVYLRVRHESAVALQLLNDEQINSFRDIFASKIPLYLQVDHIVQLQSNVREMVRRQGATSDFFDYSGDWYPHVQKCVFTVLRKGLGHRIRSLIPIDDDDEQRTSKSWNINEKAYSRETILRFGLILDGEFAFDVMDKGPQSNLPEAEEYRKFWGAKSELRRFRDGSICEACVWGNADESLRSRRLICEQIVRYLLMHHFELVDESIRYTASELDATFALDRSYEGSCGGPSNSEQLTIPVIKGFDQLAKCLRSLDELPLVITSVLGKSAAFRYCELQPNVANARTYYKDGREHFNGHVINEAVIQFESSGKWPNELNAIKRVKAAFYLQIARALRKMFELKTRANIDSLDVLKDAHFYRFKIAVPREIALYKKEVTTKGITKYRDTPESLQMERELTLIPKLTVALHTLYHQYPSFGPTVLMAKRWLYSQLIDEFLWPDECTEFLIAHQFIQSNVNNSTQPQTAFFRFLHLLAKCNWKTDMFVLNFNDELTKTYIEKLKTKSISDRDSFPPLTIITSNGEPDSHTIWSKKAPTIEILARVTLLARHANNLIKKSIFDDLVVEPLFHASLDGYDLVIKLHKKKVNDWLGHDFTKPLVSIQQRKPFIPHADYNPVASYLHELRSAYDHVAVFFYNPCGGEHITVLWKPIIGAAHEFKLTAMHGQTVGANGQLRFDRLQLKNDFAIVGKGLVESIVDNRIEWHSK